MGLLGGFRALRVLELAGFRALLVDFLHMDTYSGDAQSRMT